MRKTLTGSILLVAALCFAPALTPAQDAATKQSDAAKAERAEAKAASSATKAERAEAKIAAEQRDRMVHAYRLDFSVNELEDGKKINSRRYSMNVVSNNAEEVKIGTRVPISTGSSDNPTQAQIMYIDLGTNIWAMLRQNVDGEVLELETRTELSWTKHVDASLSSGQPAKLFTPPIVSQMKLSGDTVVTLDKPILIGSVDDPYSNRQFQLEVTVTRLK